MNTTFWSVLVECTLATGAAVVLAWLLRGPVARHFGFGAAYSLWSVVPLSLLAVLLPARRLESASAVIPGDFLQAHALAMPQPPISISGWLLSAWALGALAMLFLQLHQHRRFVAGLGPLLRRDDGLYAASKGTGLPAASGLLRHRIIVPSSFDSQYTAQERELVLYHERVHLQRGDLLANALALLLRSAFWFNPLLQLAAKRFRQDQELACDEAVIARFPHSRRAYGEAMLKTQLAARPLPLACHWNGVHPLKERIAMLKKPIPNRRTARLGLLAVSLIGISAAAAAWAAQPPESSSDSDRGPAMPPNVAGNAPAYPSAALAGKLSGQVMLVVDVAADGSVAGAVVESASPPGVFDEAALEAVKSWRFQPAIEDGKPVEGRVRVPVRFEHDWPAPTAPAAS